MAAKFLKRRGLRVLVRNYDCPAGEIDLICSDGPALVFVEVKTRASEDAESLHDALRADQWRRIRGAASFFLMQQSAQHRPCRFDVVTVLWGPGAPPEIEHFCDVQPPRS